jgi:hypothetical protein
MEFRTALSFDDGSNTNAGNEMRTQHKRLKSKQTRQAIQQNQETKHKILNQIHFVKSEKKICLQKTKESTISQINNKINYLSSLVSFVNGVYPGIVSIDNMTLEHQLVWQTSGQCCVIGGGNLQLQQKRFHTHNGRTDKQTNKHTHAHTHTHMQMCEN